MPSFRSAHRPDMAAPAGLNAPETLLHRLVSGTDCSQGWNAMLKGGCSASLPAQQPCIGKTLKVSELFASAGRRACGEGAFAPSAGCCAAYAACTAGRWQRCRRPGLRAHRRRCCRCPRQGTPACFATQDGRCFEGTLLLVSCQGSSSVQALDNVLSCNIWPLLKCRRSGVGCRC